MVRGGGVGVVLSMLTSPGLLARADLTTKKAAYLTLLKLAKFLLAVAGHSLFFLVVESQQPTSSTRVSDSTHNHAVMLQQVWRNIFDVADKYFYPLHCRRCRRGSPAPAR